MKITRYVVIDDADTQDFAACLEYGRALELAEAANNGLMKREGWRSENGFRVVMRETDTSSANKIWNY